MTEKIMTVYHGTALSIIGKGVLNGTTPLIGRRDLGDSSISGSLSNKYDYSAGWAVRRGLKPLVLTYTIPKSVLIDEGLIAMDRDTHAFVTNLNIDYQTLGTVPNLSVS